MGLLTIFTQKKTERKKKEEKELINSTQVL